MRHQSFFLFFLSIFSLIYSMIRVLIPALSSFAYPISFKFWKSVTERPSFFFLGKIKKAPKGVFMIMQYSHVKSYLFFQVFCSPHEFYTISYLNGITNEMNKNDFCPSDQIICQNLLPQAERVNHS